MSKKKKEESNESPDVNLEQAGDFVLTPLPTDPTDKGNGFDPAKRGATTTEMLRGVGVPKADINALLDKFVDPKGEVSIFLAKIRSSITRKMVILDIQRYLNDLINHRNDPKFEIKDPLEVLQLSVAKWSFPDNARWSDTLQKIIASYPQQVESQGGLNTEGGIYR
jgi:hypothetical protein